MPKLPSSDVCLDRCPSLHQNPWQGSHKTPLPLPQLSLSIAVSTVHRTPERPLLRSPPRSPVHLRNLVCPRPDQSLHPPYRPNTLNSNVESSLRQNRNKNGNASQDCRIDRPDTTSKSSASYKHTLTATNEMGAATFLSVLAGIIALVAGAIFLFGIPPQFKRAVEEKALETMGENKASYLVKGDFALLLRPA